MIESGYAFVVVTMNGMRMRLEIWRNIRFWTKLTVRVGMTQIA